MRLICFGATGGIGRQVVAQALAAGHTVTAVARHPPTLTIQHPQLTVVRGDVLEPTTFEQVMTGHDAVISTIGSRTHGPTTVCSTGVTNMLQAMQSASVRRLLCISASDQPAFSARLSNFTGRCSRLYCHAPDEPRFISSLDGIALSAVTAALGAPPASTPVPSLPSDCRCLINPQSVPSWGVDEALRSII